MDLLLLGVDLEALDDEEGEEGGQDGGEDQVEGEEAPLVAGKVPEVLCRDLQVIKQGREALGVVPLQRAVCRQNKEWKNWRKGGMASAPEGEAGRPAERRAALRPIVRSPVT